MPWIQWTPMDIVMTIVSPLFLVATMLPYCLIPVIPASGNATALPSTNVTTPGVPGFRVYTLASVTAAVTNSARVSRLEEVETAIITAVHTHTPEFHTTTSGFQTIYTPDSHPRDLLQKAEDVHAHDPVGVLLTPARGTVSPRNPKKPKHGTHNPTRLTTHHEPSKTRVVLDPTQPTGNNGRKCERMNGYGPSFRIQTEVVTHSLEFSNTTGDSKFDGLYLSNTADAKRSIALLTPAYQYASRCVYNPNSMTIAVWLDDDECWYAALAMLEGGEPHLWGDVEWRSDTGSAHFVRDDDTEEIVWDNDRFGAWIACEYQGSLVLHYYERSSASSPLGGPVGSMDNCAWVKLKAVPL